MATMAASLPGLRVMAKRKSKERRSEPRVDLDRATVRLEDRVYPLKNWSAHGFLAGSYGGELKVGDKVEIRVSVPFVGVAREFSGLARVVRVDEDRAEIGGIWKPWAKSGRAKLSTPISVGTGKNRPPPAPAGGASR